MIAFPAGVRLWIAGGGTDMRRAMNTLALHVQQGLGRDPHAGEIFCLRGRRARLHCRGEGGAMLRAQERRLPRRLAVEKPGRALGIEPQHEVAHDLQGHPADPRRL